ncbi:Putative ankyrin repeat protein MM_0045 [Araneus ventricosus]|uniref:Ankyrin repeat protein MM_0045 n=1 Tax=Araneus ventricosus TaxID=182803 RepID=A0A4Y2RMW2_ARAVE|nr:Putative ankyrin repeat protein MM_0045 [Araneus ventricosus]
MYHGEDSYEDEINIDFMKIKLLLEENADVNIRDEYEETPLCRVMRLKRYDIIKLFSESATELKNIKDRYGITPLYYAVKYGLYDVIELFLAKGADVNARNEDNETALSCAIRLGDSDLVKLFLESGADMNAKYKNDKTILHLACDGDGHLDIIKILLRKGSDVHAKNEFDQVPIHAAVYRNHVDYIQLLLERGASVHVADINGWTPMHAAAYKGHVEVIRALLDKGADVNSKNKEGKTPLDLATENKNQLCIDALQKLRFEETNEILTEDLRDITDVPISPEMTSQVRNTCELSTATVKELLNSIGDTNAIAGPSGISMHLRRDPEKRKFSCDLCNKEYDFKCQSDNHNRNFTGEKPFACDVCKK